MSAQRHTCSTFALLKSQYFNFMTIFKKSTEGVQMSYMCLAAFYVIRGIIFLRIFATDLHITLIDTSQTAIFTIYHSRSSNFPWHTDHASRRIQSVEITQNTARYYHKCMLSFL
jgi:hypothetical protein